MAKKTNCKRNGKDYFRITKRIDGVQKVFYGASKKEAEQKRDAYITLKKSGLVAGGEKALFCDVFNKWYDEVLTPSVKLKSANRYEIDKRLRIDNSSLSKMKLIDITALVLDTYYSELLSKYSPTTIDNSSKLLSNFFNYCEKKELIVKNPHRLATVPKAEKKAKTNKALSQTDVKILASEAENNLDNFIFLFLALSGLRIGECLALTHKDICLENMTINVDKTSSQVKIDGKYQIHIDTPKTKSSIRTVPILPELKNLLSAHIANEKTKYNPLPLDFMEKPLFSSTACTHRESANVRKQLKRLQNRLDMELTSPHALRHTFITLCAEKNVPLTTTAVLVGHSDIKMTAEIYTHVSNEQAKKDIAKLSGIFSA